MKKLLLSQILFFIAFVSAAQQENKNHLQKANPNSPASFELNIGNTTYDLQNYCSGRKQVYFHPNGSVEAIWNFDASFGPFNPATGYNYFDGATWGVTTPLATLPPFGSIVSLSNGTDVVISYDEASSSGLRIDTCNVPGMNNWAGALMPPEPNGHKCGWPHSAAGGANGMSIHVISLTEPVSFGGFPYSGVDGMLTYSRSEDGGATWNIVHATLPGWNSSVTKRMMPDNYAIDAWGNTVAITAGGKTNDWVMWKSVDNGNTFTKTTIDAFPITAYDELTMISDTNADAVADTVAVPDGSLEILIDNNGMVHCWSGSRGIIDDDIPSVFQEVPFSGIQLLYWNESMGSTSPSPIANVEDIDGDGMLTLQPSDPIYGTGLCSMPSAGIDQTGKIYVCYACMVEGTSNGGVPGQSYRDILGMYTPNNGITWSSPAFLTFSEFEEEAFPSMARNVDSTVKIIFMRDSEPGLSSWGDLDPITVADIWYLEADTGLWGVGPIMGSVSGQIYFDENNNNVFDGIDNYASAALVQVNQLGTWYTSNFNGIYYSYLVYGNNLIEPYDLPIYINSNPPSVTYNVTVSSTYTQDFALHAVAAYDSATIFMNSYGQFCFNTGQYNPIITNYGTTTKNYVVKFHPDPVLTSPVFINPAPDSVVSGDYYFSINNLGPLALNNNIHLAIITPGPGIPVTTYVDLYENNAGVLTYAHSDTIAKIISCSYDPNDKTADPIGVGTQHYTLKNNFIEYLIRFQNTGNDTAFNVMILDTLDANFDFSTFQILNTSHQMNVEVLTGNILRFRFNNILLPDSNVNEPASHGYIRYRIKPLASVPVNTIVYNTSHIYFDFNPPVATNTTYNTLVNVIPTGVNENAFTANNISIIPNPFNESVKIVFENKTHDEAIIRISDITGRIIYTGQALTEVFLWDSRNVEKGIYLLSIQKSLTGEKVSALMVKQ